MNERTIDENAVIPGEALDMMVDEYPGETETTANHVYGLLCEVARSHKQQAILLTEAKNLLLEVLVHADTPLSDESKTKARAFVQSLDEKVKNGQQSHGVGVGSEVPLKEESQ